MAGAVIIVPPFLKFVAGPLLGPAMLAGAGREAGHRVEVIDMNATFIEERRSNRTGDARFVGDHDRPTVQLRAIQLEFREITAATLPLPAGEAFDDPSQTLPFDHDAVMRAASALANGQTGIWIVELLGHAEPPNIVGVSVLYSGQVLWGLAASIIARRLWPTTVIAWGGPHVTALQDRIEHDVRYGRLIDRFVFGYAERTFVAMLDAAERGSHMPSSATRAGVHAVRAIDDGEIMPLFERLGQYGTPRVTLPAQVSRGCAYGKCRFCTYPAIEGAFRPLYGRSLESTVGLAATMNGAVALKDSLLLPQRLIEVGRVIGGRVTWSGCTKLHPRLDAAFMTELAANGCRTLEFGLETLTPAGQLTIDKHQSPRLFLSTLDAAGEAGISVVVNYITGFPGVSPYDDGVWLDFVRDALSLRPILIAKIELNTFQLERLSPMARDAKSAGVEITAEWAWATVLQWQALPAQHRLAS